jgi:acetyl-CoA acetyltransferase
MTHPFSGKYSIVGLGVTPCGRVTGNSLLWYEAEAARLAIEDAGLKNSDIGAALQALSDPGGGMRIRHDDAFPRVLGLPTKVYYENVGRGGEYAAMAIIIATQLIDLGVANYVVVSGARDDWSRSRRIKEKGERGTGMAPRVGRWGQFYGINSAVLFHAFFGAAHMKKYGTTPEQMAQISISQREWACRNPEATMYGRPMTLDDYMDSPMVAEPYRLLDICQQSDGGIAFIVTTTERARDLKQKPVKILGVGFGEQMDQMLDNQEHLTQLAVKSARDQAFAQSGLTLKDIDVAQLYDCFTGEVMFQIEDYGWCKKGEVGAFLADGHLGPKGDLPINTSGGLLSAYHMGNLTGFAEGVRQIRGTCGDHQIKDAEVSLVTGHGGEILSGQMCSIHSTLLLGR